MNKTTTREYLKAMSTRISHYREILQGCDYIYIATDSIVNRGCAYLWPLLCNGGVLHTSPFILVAPALDKLESLPAYQEARALRQEDIVTFRADNTDAWERPEYFSVFKYALERAHGRERLTSQLHVMQKSPTAKAWEKDVTEQQAIQQAVLFRFKSARQVVISQDVSFLRGLHQICNSDPGKSSLTTLILDEAGYLDDPFDSSEEDLKTRMAVNNLMTITNSTPLFIDDSALKHPMAADFMRRIKPALLGSGKSLSVLTYKNESLPLSDLLIARAQEVPPTIRFSWLDEYLDKTDAFINAIISEGSKLELPHVAVITDRVARAEKIRVRARGAGIKMDIYSINQYGFLSCRSDSRKLRHTIRNSEQIDAAVRSGNISEVQMLAADRSSWEEAVKSCLNQNNTVMLESLVDQADKISHRIIRWIITEFRQFKVPSYLAEHPKVYELIVKMLSKVISLPLSSAEELQEHLSNINDKEGASHIELEYLSSIFSDARMHSVGAILPMARIRRAMLTDKPPRSENSPELERKLRKKELDMQAEKIRNQIAKLQKELAWLESKSKAIESNDEPLGSSENKTNTNI